MGACTVSRLTPTGRIRRAVFERCGDECECCGVAVTFESGHLDHFAGRARVPESVSSTWFLCPPCDHDKTLNKPTAVWWLTRFSEHCNRHGYAEEWERAQTRLAVLAAKFPEATT